MTNKTIGIIHPGAMGVTVGSSIKAGGYRVIWASENRVTTAYGINSKLGHVHAPVRSRHPGGAQFIFADGHVDFVSEQIDQEILQALTTRNWGEVISDYE